MLHPERQLLPSHQTPQGTRTVAIALSKGSVLEVVVIEAANPRGVIIACHGYHANHTQLYAIAQGLRDRQYTVVLFDFPGHGTRRGRCTFGGDETRDLEAILRWLAQQPDRAQLPVGLVGFSFGGAVACQAAAQSPQIGALVLDSTYARLFLIVARSIKRRYHLPEIPWAWVTWWTVQAVLGRRLIHVDPEVLASIIQQPAFLIHGTHDQSVPVEHTNTLYARWRGPKQRWLEPGAGHVGTSTIDPARYCNQLAQFFDRWLQPLPRSSPA